MKKFIGIIVLILLSGIGVAEAQHAGRQRTSQSSGALTASTLVTKSRYMSGACQSNLKRIGFTLTSTSKTTLYDTDTENDYERIAIQGTKKTYQKGGIKVYLYFMPRNTEPAYIEVSFPNQMERDRFLNTFNNLGFNNMGGGSYFSPMTGLTVQTEGNLVVLDIML